MSEHIIRPLDKDMKLIRESLDKACAYIDGAGPKQAVPDRYIDTTIPLKVLRHRPHPVRAGLYDHKYPAAAAKAAAVFEYAFVSCYKTYRPLTRALIKKEILSPHTAFLPHRLGWMDGSFGTLLCGIISTLYDTITPYLTSDEIASLECGKEAFTAVLEEFSTALSPKAKDAALKDIDAVMFKPQRMIRYLLLGTATDEPNERITLTRLMDGLDILFIAYGGLSAFGRTVLPETITKIEKTYCINPAASLENQPLLSYDSQGKDSIPIRDVFCENNIDRLSYVCDLLQFITTDRASAKGYSTSELFISLSTVPYWYKKRFVTAETLYEDTYEAPQEEPIERGPTVYEKCLETARTVLMTIDKHDTSREDIEKIFKAMGILSENLGENVSPNIKRSCENLYIPETITTLKRYVRITREKNAPKEPIEELRETLKTAAKLFTECTAMRNEYADISIASDARVARKLMSEALATIEDI